MEVFPRLVLELGGIVGCPSEVLDKHLLGHVRYTHAEMGEVRTNSREGDDEGGVVGT